MRLQRAEDPLHSRDLTDCFEYDSGRKVRSDALGIIDRSEPKPQSIMQKLYALLNRQRKTLWRRHQSLAYHRQGKCAWEDCPGKKQSKAKRPRSYDTVMRCEECSALRKKNMFFSAMTQRRVCQLYVTLPSTINITTKNTEINENWSIFCPILLISQSFPLANLAIYPPLSKHNPSNHGPTPNQH